MIIELPWPPKECGRNFQRRKHWSKYRKAVKHYRDHCGWIVKTARSRGIITRIEFYPPDARARDDDNVIGAFKSGRDGIADVLGVDDVKFRPTYVIGEPCRPDGKVIVTIEEA